jgi:large subunit ribosomal protein L22
MGISYSVEVDEERTAKAMGREMSISKKDAVELCRFVKGRSLEDARETLSEVADGDEPVPLKKHNSGSGHTSGIDGWDAGGFPKKAAEAINDVLYNAKSNATEQGFDTDEMVVDHIAAHKVGESRGMKPRAMGRATQWNSDLVDVEVVLLQEDYEPLEGEEQEEETEEPETESVETEEEVEETETEASEADEEAQQGGDT